MRSRSLLPGWIALAVCLAALAGALASARAGEPTEPAASAAPAPAPSDASPRGAGHGLYPLFEDAEVPAAWMPPGVAATPVPSDEVFPPQTIAIRFNHGWHVKQLKLSCRACHAGVYESEAAKDRNLPSPETCDGCHDCNHSNLAAVKAGTDPNGQCAFCHLGEDAGVEGVVALSVWPEPNLRFPHKKHLARNIGCPQCHGAVDELELATRDQLPRMAGCFTCHALSGAAAGDARGDCTVCHLTEPNGLLRTAFPTGKLEPPHWLHGADHGPDWIARHQPVAAANSAMCGSCHASPFCTDCHDGKVRPRQVHPNDWLSMHAQAARQDSPRCVSCHQLQSFCGDCHRRVGVARDAPAANRGAGRRFHPPEAEWSRATRGARHHSFEAMRNLNACVSCHTERDCASCHASKGLPGAGGTSPHPLGFESSCASALRRNPRPCLVCHESRSAVLGRCR
ncbi:MAG: cytochrome c3 family protein [Polyangiaceae bacterium]|nr:cytochrome c3 family protein [Polyangiaceae bacterium]